MKNSNVMANSIVFTAEHYHSKEMREIEWLAVSVIIVIHSSDLIWINGLPYRMSSIRITEKETTGKEKENGKSKNQVPEKKQ